MNVILSLLAFSSGNSFHGEEKKQNNTNGILIDLKLFAAWLDLQITWSP